MKNSYGFDRLSRDMLMLAVALGIIGLAFFGSISGFVLLFTAVLLTALMLFRTLSVNGNKRANELRGYERVSAVFLQSCSIGLKISLRGINNIGILHARNAASVCANRAARARFGSHAQNAAHSLKSEPDSPRCTADTEKTGTAAMQRIPFRIAGTSMMHRTCRIAL